MDASVVLAGCGGAALLAAGIARLASTKKEADNTGQTEAGSETVPVHGSMANSSDEIEWQESADVYAPTEVLAPEFVGTLGLARQPAILPQQSYIFIRRALLDKIQAHLRGNLEVEQGGLLLGQAFYDPELHTYLLVIRESLAAPDGTETPTFFGYTTATWRALTPQLQQMPADWTLLGSYHSHPDMGVFLSQTDLDTQEEIFCADWQIALVIDPVRDEIGFFVGKDGQQCAEWYFLRD